MQRGLMVMALCMVLLQSVVGMHRVLHFQNSNAPFTVTSMAVSNTVVAESHARAVPGEGHMIGLWGDHTRVSDCQLLDQACADVWPQATWQVPSKIQTPCFVAQTLPGRWVTLVVFFSARGPPVVS